jgi:hypothetical protein
MPRKRYRKEETRPWVQEKAAEAPAWQPEITIEDVDGREIEVRRMPDGSRFVRPPSVTFEGPDGVPYTERVVAAAWFVGFYAPWFRRQRGLAERALPAANELDGLLIEEEDHGRFNESE